MAIREGGRQFAHVECKDDADWIKQRITMETEGARQRRIPAQDLVELCQTAYENLKVLVCPVRMLSVTSSGDREP